MRKSDLEINFEYYPFSVMGYEIFSIAYKKRAVFISKTKKLYYISFSEKKVDWFKTESNTIELLFPIIYDWLFSVFSAENLKIKYPKLDIPIERLLFEKNIDDYIQYYWKNSIEQRKTAREYVLWTTPELIRQGIDPVPYVEIEEAIFEFIKPGIHLLPYISGHLGFSVTNYVECKGTNTIFPKICCLGAPKNLYAFTIFENDEWKTIKIANREECIKMYLDYIPKKIDLVFPE